MHRRDLDGVLVNAVCPYCAAPVAAPYSLIVATRQFSCRCGERFAADMVKASTAAMLGLLEDAA